MTTLELHLDDDLKNFVDRQSQLGGHSSPEAYVESLLAMEHMRSQSARITSLLVAAVEEDPNPQDVDDSFWAELKSEILARSPQ